MKPILLFITNLYNRDYQEDLFISEYLRQYFHVVIAHPTDCQGIEDHAAGILIRNSWPAWKYEQEYWHMIQRFQDKKLNVYSDLHGLGEIKGKDHLVTLYQEGYNVIPTVDTFDNIEKLPTCQQYLIKPKNGCGSHGLETLTLQELSSRNLDNYVIQPYLDFQHEISFYFIDKELQYALYNPDKSERWQMTLYTPTPAEVQLAETFVHWNTMRYGIQRIDFCKMHNNELLLMEVEDHNPSLSIFDIFEDVRSAFLQKFVQSLQQNLNIMIHEEIKSQ